MNKEKANKIKKKFFKKMEEKIAEQELIMKNCKHSWKYAEPKQNQIDQCFFTNTKCSKCGKDINQQILEKLYPNCKIERR